MTTVPTADKNDLKAKISKLGGSVVENASEKVTGCIAGSLMRNEKVLVALASGIPLLPMDFVHQSAEQQKWLGKKTYKLSMDSFLTEKSKNEELVYTNCNSFLTS